MPRERKASFNAVVRLLLELPSDVQCAIVDNPGAFHAWTRKLAEDSKDHAYVVPLTDDEVPDTMQERLRAFRLYTVHPHRSYTGPVAWRTKAGYTLKQHAPKMGRCYDFEGISGRFRDTPTEDAIVFWAPCPVLGSENKNSADQLVLLWELRDRFNFPAHWCNNFGTPALLAGLYLAYQKYCGNRVPRPSTWARSTVFSGMHIDGQPDVTPWNSQLLIGNHTAKNGLVVKRVHQDEPDENVFCYALGIEKLEDHLVRAMDGDPA
ncbi:hypothetical protein ACFL2M_00020 [Patescibacteria group bacterium]